MRDLDQISDELERSVEALAKVTDELTALAAYEVRILEQPVLFDEWNDRQKQYRKLRATYSESYKKLTILL